MSDDAVLTIDPTTGAYDFEIDGDGDIKTVDFFDTAILYSLFGERRASADEVVDAHRRRGWIGNSDFENGSKLWLYSQARLTRDTMNSVQDEAKKSLDWMVEDGLAVSIGDPTVALSGGRLLLEVIISRSRDKIDRRLYDVWEATGIEH